MCEYREGFYNPYEAPEATIDPERDFDSENKIDRAHPLKKTLTIAIISICHFLITFSLTTLFSTRSSNYGWTTLSWLPAGFCFLFGGIVNVLPVTCGIIVLGLGSMITSVFTYKIAFNHDSGRVGAKVFRIKKPRPNLAAILATWSIWVPVPENMTLPHWIFTAY